MGNQSGSDYGGTYIRTDKPFYFAGEIVTGNIYLNIVRPGFPGNVVILKVTGKEKSQWTETRGYQEKGPDGKMIQRTEIITYSGKNQFYQHKIAIWTFQGQSLPVGQYTFPFQFQLLPHLPGSYLERRGNDLIAKTSYHVKAEIDSYNRSIKSIRSIQEMIVREPLKTAVGALMGEMQVNAKTWCCIDKGTSYIKGVFDKSHYLPGDVAYLWIDLDNSQCQLDIKRIEASLINYLTLRDRTGREKMFTRVIAQQNIEGIEAGIKAIENDRKQLQLPLQNKDGIRPSSNGQLVRSVYQLEVKAILSGCTCCNTHPNVKVPIEIVAPVPQIYDQPIPQPSNWSPQVFQPQLIQFTDSAMYSKENQQQQSNYNYPPNNQFQQMVQPMS